MNVAVPGGKGAAEVAGRLSGYTLVEARNLSRDKGIVNAVKELMEQRLVLEAGGAIDTLTEAMSYGKDKVRAANSILDRVISSKTQLTVEATGPVDRTAETLKHLQHMMDLGATEEVLVKEFGSIGLQHYRALLAKQNSDNAKIIEAEVIEATETTEARIETLDDLL